VIIGIIRIAPFQMHTDGDRAHAVIPLISDHRSGPTVPHRKPPAFAYNLHFFDTGSLTLDYARLE
jgi:hypothetical protein